MYTEQINTNSSNSITYLAKRYPHQRDHRILFEEEGHKYTIDGVDAKKNKNPFTSVTTFVHQQFEPFEADKIIAKMMASQKWSKSKYFGKTADEIKGGWKQAGNEAAAAGTKMHNDIERFYNNMDVNNTSVEYGYFQNFYKDMEKLREACITKKGWPGEPYRTEWTVFDEDLRLAGSIDMCFKKSDGTITIYDWKRSKEIKKTNWFMKFSKNPALSQIPDLNYWHYSLQLNIYKMILERKYGEKVSEMYLVCLHPNHANYQQIEITDMSIELGIIVKQIEATLENTSVDNK